MSRHKIKYNVIALKKNNRLPNRNYGRFYVNNMLKISTQYTRDNKGANSKTK